MSTIHINLVEKELDRFVKFLALKYTQAIVQSRLGIQIVTQCNPMGGHDWFNIVIEDHPEVYTETKKALALTPGVSALKRLPLCVEISLRTAEGDQMILEIWSLDIDTAASNKVKDANEKAQKQNFNSAASEQTFAKLAHNIYNRMGMLLKSLISISRATPAYKLSRHQSPDSYSMYYRIYVHPPQTDTLGEGHKCAKFGNVITREGNLSLSVAFRTEMTLTSTTDGQAKTREGSEIMIDSNYFKLTKSGANHNGSGENDEKKIIDLERPLKPGAFTDMGRVRQYTEDDFVLPETPPFEWLLRKPRHESCDSASTDYGGSFESLNRKCDSPQTSPLGNGHQNNININNALNNNSFNNNNNANAANNNAAGFRSFENDGNLQQQPQKSPDNSIHSQSPIKSLLVPQPPITIIKTPNSSTSNLSVTQFATHHNSPDDESFLKELNFPFAKPSSVVNDLAKFYRDCYHAPPLKGFSELQAEICSTTTPNSSETKATCSSTTQQPTNPQTCSAASNSTDFSFVDDLSKQLEQFETSLEDYDKLVSQFGILQTSSSTGSRSSGGGLQMSN